MMRFWRHVTLILLLLLSVSAALAQDNSPPTAVDDFAFTAVDTSVAVPVAANDSDVDGNLDATSAAPTTGGTNGVAIGNGDGTITYFPNPGFTGTDSFTYQICDTDLECSTATVEVQVLAADAAPIAQDDAATTDEDTPVSINVIANDIDTDLDPTSVSIQSGPTNGTAASNGDGSVTYTPALNYFGPDSFTYQVCDLTAQCASANVTIEVLPVNDPPDCSGAGPTIDSIWPPNHKMVDVGVVGVTDVDNDPITITITDITQDEDTNGTGDGNTDPDSSGVGTDTGQVRAERSGNGNGRVYHISFTADDGNGGTCDGTVNVGVPHDQRPDGAPVDDGAVPDEETEAAHQPGDFGCDHPGNYCNAPGHNKDNDDAPEVESSQSRGNGNNGNGRGNGNGNGNNGNGNGNNGNGNGKGKKGK